MEQHPLSVSRDEFVARAGQEYDKLRERFPAQRCVSVTREGKPCQAFAVNGTTLCEAHGGRMEKNAIRSDAPVVVGPKRPKLKLTGRMDEIREVIKENSANILDSTEEIEVLTARFQFLLEQSENLPILSDKALQQFDLWLNAKASGNKQRFAEATNRLERALENCRAGISATHELYVLTEQLRRFKETEIKRRIAMRQMMDASDVTKLIDAMKLCVNAGLAAIPAEYHKPFKEAFAKHYRQIFMMPKEPTTHNNARTGGANPFA
jgi:hypothetical protein